MFKWSIKTIHIQIQWCPYRIISYRIPIHNSWFTIHMLQTVPFLLQLVSWCIETKTHKNGNENTTKMRAKRKKKEKRKHKTEEYEKDNIKQTTSRQTLYRSTCGRHFRHWTYVVSEQWIFVQSFSFVFIFKPLNFSNKNTAMRNYSLFFVHH